MTFELSVDQKTGVPEIIVQHHDRSNDLFQKLVGIFAKGATKYGLQLLNPNGHLESGADNSWENYKIVIKPVLTLSQLRIAYFEEDIKKHQNTMIGYVAEATKLVEEIRQSAAAAKQALGEKGKQN